MKPGRLVQDGAGQYGLKVSARAGFGALNEIILAKN